MRSTIYILILSFLLFSTIFPTSARIEELIGEELNFKIDESADYTNHLDDSMLISVAGSFQTAYNILNAGGDQDTGWWISGLEQLSVENMVQIGKLRNSGFNATSGSEKSASVRTFNISLALPANYSDIVHAVPAVFIANATVNTTLVDGRIVPTAIVRAPVNYFMVDSQLWIQALKTYFLDYATTVKLELGLTATVEAGAYDLSYKISGEMIDIHQFTYVEGGVSDVIDYNRIKVDGGFSIKYTEKGVLSEYIENYEISFEDTRILQYAYSIKIGSGSIGNIHVGDTPISSGNAVLVVVIAIIVIITIVQLVRARK